MPIVAGLVLAQDPPQVGLVPDEGAVQELAAASSDPAFGDRVHPRLCLPKISSAQVGQLVGFDGGRVCWLLSEGPLVAA